MKIDFHVHTNFSWDTFSSPREVVDSALQKGIDCLCITDHSEIKGAIEAMKYGFDKNILIIPGIEILSASGDILGINIKNKIPNGLPALDTIKEIKKGGGMAIVPHPFWFFTSLRPKKKAFLSADAIEVFNAGIFDYMNKKAQTLAEKYNLCFTAGSDAHRAEYVGRGYFEIPDNNLSEKEIIEEVKKKMGKAIGKVLNFWEIIESGLKISPLKLINYYRLKSRN